MTSGPSVVLFGSGSPLSTAALEALAPRSWVVGVVVPGRRRAGTLRSALRETLRWRAQRPLRRLAGRLGLPSLTYSTDASRGDFETRLRERSPDLLCVASFPCLLPPSVLAIPKIGAFGVHPSLLPRHRGPEPLFWTYFHDDREAGITVHWLDAGEDTGDVIEQEAVPLPRGQDVARLYRELSERGSRLLVRAVEDAAAGRIRRRPQDESRATREGLPRPGTWRIDFETWGAERLWHFLSGLGERHGRLLADADRGYVLHGRALGFRQELHDQRPGTLERRGRGWRVACMDGFVDVAGPRLATRVRGLLLRTLAAPGSGSPRSA